jgi:hypothetical protein
MDKDKLNMLIEKMQKKGSGGVQTAPLEEIEVKKQKLPPKETEKPIETPEVEEEDVEEYDSDLDDDSDLDSDEEIQKKIHLLQDKQKEIKKAKEIKEIQKPIEKSVEKTIEKERSEELKINPLVDEGIFRTELLLGLNFHNQQIFRIANLLEKVFGDEKAKD